MVGDVVMRDVLAKQAGVPHQVDVLAPVPGCELLPCAMDFVANLRQPLTVSHRAASRRPFAVGGNQPRRPVFRKNHLGRGERHDRNIPTGLSVAFENKLETAPGKPAVMLDARDAFFLQREEDAIR